MRKRLSVNDLEKAVLAINSSVNEGKWGIARRDARRLVAGLEAAENSVPGVWLSLEAAAREVGRALVRQQRNEFAAAVMNYLNELQAAVTRQHPAGGENSSRSHEGWVGSRSICTFSDHERHLGQVVKVGSGWLAFDGTHLNPEGTGFRSLGAFSTITAAKEAVEMASRMRMKTSGCAAN